MRQRCRLLRLTAAIVLLASAAEAQPGSDGVAPEPRAPTSEKRPTPPPAPSADQPNASTLPAAGDAHWDTLRVGAWVDAYYGYNWNDPASNTNGVRAFDYRHNSFALQMAALDISFDTSRLPKSQGGGSVLAKLTLQAGDAPDQYYLSSGSENAADTTSNYTDFRHVQQAFGGYRWPMGHESTLEIDAGVFATHMGYEGINTKDNWTYSRSLLYQFGPFYNTGVRAIYVVSPKFTAQLNVTNGWNSVIDNNRSKSIGAQLVWTPTDKVAATLNWIGGAEQDASLNVRNTFDAFVLVKATPALSFLGNFDVGFDKVRAGVPLNGQPAASDTSVSWYGGAAYARYEFTPVLAATLRGEVFRDTHGSPWITGVATTIVEGTGTFEVKPNDHLILRLELRHDQADAALYDRHDLDLTAPRGGGFPPPMKGKGQTTSTLGAIVVF